MALVGLPVLRDTQISVLEQP